MSDFTSDDGSGLVIWGTAETAVTIVATTIPVLRVLIHGLKGRPCRTTSTDEWTHKKTRTGRSTAVITADRSRFEQNNTSDMSQKHDDRSDWHIVPGAGDGKIMQTREVAVEYEDRGDEESLACEMAPCDSNGDMSGLASLELPEWPETP